LFKGNFITTTASITGDDGIIKLFVAIKTQKSSGEKIIFLNKMSSSWTGKTKASNLNNVCRSAFLIAYDFSDTTYDRYLDLY
jgi:hypothetical protein